MYNILSIIQMKFRKETDSMGTINVADDKYWGASTERSKKYFDIGKILVSKTLINAIAMIKLAAAKVHKNEKQIDAKICDAIVKASKEIIAGKLDGNFPLKVWQTGSGTQTNMNVNEVIANRAIQILGGKKVQKNQFIQMIMLINLNQLMTFFLQLCILQLLLKRKKNYYPL